jgi:hypothetical protein
MLYRALFIKDTNSPNTTLTLMAVHAHPDDKSIGTGGILAKYAAGDPDFADNQGLDPW